MIHLWILSLGLILGAQKAFALEYPKSQEEFKSYRLDRDSSDTTCLLPFDRKSIGFHDIYNDFDGRDQEHLAPNDYKKAEGAYEVAPFYRYRYLVADLNTQQYNNQGELECRGVQEKHPLWEELPESELGESLKSHYEKRVQNYKTLEIQKDPIIHYKGRNYCMGQTVNVCETDFNKKAQVARVRLIGRFITSTKMPSEYHPWVRKFDHYYAPVMFIAQRGWEKGLAYTAEDEQRDQTTGGSKGPKVTYYSKIPGLALPNFMYFKAYNIGATRQLPEHPDWRWNWIDGNGIHQNTSAVGKALESFMGAPISKGCIRLTKYASKFVRWYIPRGAKFFFIDDPDLYQSVPPNP